MLRAVAVGAGVILLIFLIFACAMLQPYSQETRVIATKQEMNAAESARRHQELLRQARQVVEEMAATSKDPKERAEAQEMLKRFDEQIKKAQKRH
jgi:hypothetical protein